MNSNNFPDKSFLPKGGGYRRLLAFQTAEIIYDLTVVFTQRYISRGSRTKDQMEQAARSGMANIAEGSAASPTSRETEIKLTNVAKASLEELLLDYECYLRQHGLPLWQPGNPRLERLRAFLKTDRFKKEYLMLAARPDMEPEAYCNLCITLIRQTSYLLGKLLAAQEAQFLAQGGIRESMYRARMAARGGGWQAGAAKKEE